MVETALTDVPHQLGILKLVPGATMVEELAGTISLLVENQTQQRAHFMVPVVAVDTTYLVSIHIRAQAVRAIRAWPTCLYPQRKEENT